MTDLIGNADQGEDRITQALRDITEIAEQRRRLAQPSLSKSLPEWILEIGLTEALYTLSPRVLPLKQISFAALADILKRRYNVRFKRPDLGPFVPADVTDDQIGQSILASADPELTFTDGRFPRTTNDFVVIRRIQINDESILAGVQGTGEVADLIVAEVAEAIWGSAGVTKDWSSIEPSVQLKAYGSGTIVDLGWPFEDMLSEGLRGFVQERITSDGGFANSMGRLSARHQFLPNGDFTSLATLSEVTLKVHLFDRKTGRPDSARLHFSVSTKDTEGTGIVLVSSELPFADHVQLLSELRSRSL